MTLYDEYRVWGIYYVTLRDLFYMNNHMIGNAILVVSEFVQIGHSRYVVCALGMICLV